MRRLLSVLLVCCVGLYVTTAYAEESLLQRKDVQRFIYKMVKKYHFKKKQLVAVLREAQFQPRIIESMEKPYEKKTWDVYKQLFLTPERVQAGLEYWRSNQKTLERAQKEYGVPASVIVAIIGVETLYGKHQGTYRVLDALTTLAFHYPKRSPFFTKELGEFLLLCREQGVSPTEYMGSYAGAMGKPQFMPSSYRFYAVDYAGNGKRDLMREDTDVIGSVANYFHKHGWKMNDGVAQLAQVKGRQYKKLTTNARKPEYTLKHLMADGVTPLSPVIDHPKKAGLIELITQTGPEYWLAYPNFYVITRYNTSPQYALVVYLFSQQLDKQWASNRNTSAA